MAIDRSCRSDVYGCTAFGRIRLSPTFQRGNRNVSHKVTPVEGAGVKCYFPSMTLDRVRLLFVLFLILTLAVGITTHGVHAANVGSEIVVADARCGLTPGKCSSGGDNDVLSLVPCSALNCNSATATEGSNVAIDVFPVGLGDPINAPAMTGHNDPPDPYPPRLAVLS